MTLHCIRAIVYKNLPMVAYKHIDYFLYFEDDEIARLECGEKISHQMQHYTTRESLMVSLETKEKLWEFKKGKVGILSFQNETMLAVIWMTENDPTEHSIFFEKEWFLGEMRNMIKGERGRTTIRWGADKIEIMAGIGREATMFKLMYGE